MAQVKIDSKNMKDAILDKMSETVKLSTSFDNEAKKNKETAEVELEIDMNGVALSDVLTDALSSLRIKINAMLKKHAVDSETYLAYLAKNDHKFKFTYAEIGGSTRGSNALSSGVSAYSRMTPEEQEMFRKFMAENESKTA